MTQLMMSFLVRPSNLCRVSRVDARLSVKKLWEATWNTSQHLALYTQSSSQPNTCLEVIYFQQRSTLFVGDFLRRRPNSPGSIECAACGVSHLRTPHADAREDTWINERPNEIQATGLALQFPWARSLHNSLSLLSFYIFFD
eukprot:g67907.t1